MNTQYHIISWPLSDFIRTARLLIVDIIASTIVRWMY